MTSRWDLREEMRRYFGHEAFRPGQEEVLRSLLAGRDTLAVLPTGGGKSLTFQLAALLLPGMTIVVSPLLSLMKDQVDSLRERGIEDVSELSSMLRPSEEASELHDLAAEQTKILYVTPERFGDLEFRAALGRTTVSLFVVDEAHCISEWGFDFRPAYLRLDQVIADLGHPTVLALTATATPQVRRDIAERLGLHTPAVVVRGFDRPNLFWSAHRVSHAYEKRRMLAVLLQSASVPAGRLGAVDLGGAGIVYVATTRAAREVAQFLNGGGVGPTAYYHGQMRKTARTAVQEAFNAGQIRVIVATNAFGLGIDKPDIRFVVHFDTPGSLESLYQEAGRAGRDGKPALHALIYREADLGRQAFLSGGGHIRREEAGAVVEVLRSHGTRRLAEITRLSNVSLPKIERLLSALAAQGAVRRRRGAVVLLRDDPDLGPLVASEERRQVYDRTRLEMVRAYASTAECRRRFLLNYFGEEYPWEFCGACDADVESRAGERPRRVTEGVGPFRVGHPVHHVRFGRGVVERVEPEAVYVLFEQAGYRVFDPATVLAEELLQPAD